MQEILIGLALVVVLSVTARLVAAVLRVPAIVPLLVAGALAGGALGLIEPPELLGDALTPMISIAVGIVLFEGALKLRLSDLSGGSHRVVLRLVTVGVAITWGLTFAAMLVLFDLPTEIDLLLAAVLIVSGPTVVLPMLDFIRPRRQVATALRWEGILVDPIGAIIAVMVFGALRETDGDTGFHLGELSMTVGVGAVIGLAGAAILLPLLATDRLSGRDKVAAGLMVVVGAFAAADSGYEDAGLVAVIATGLVLANQRRVDIDRLVEFSETLVPLLIGILFVLLAANVDLAGVVDLGIAGVALVAAIVLVVRPVAALASTIGSRLDWRERAFIAAIAPKGIVAASTASVFGLQLVNRGAEGAEEIVPVTFLVIAGTVLVYAIGAPPLARFLGVAWSAPPRLLIVGAPEWALRLGEELSQGGVDVQFWAASESEVEAVGRHGLELAPDPLLGDELLEEDALESVSAVLLVSEDDALNQLLAAQLGLRLDDRHIYALPPAPGSRQAVSVHPHRLLTGDAAEGERLAREISELPIRSVTSATEAARAHRSIAAVSFGSGSRPARIDIGTPDRPAHRRRRADLYIVADSS